jgi:hypothetical protein
VVQGHVVRNVECYLRERDEGGGKGEEEGGERARELCLVLPVLAA